MDKLKILMLITIITVFFALFVCFSSYSMTITIDNQDVELNDFTSSDHNDFYVGYNNGVFFIWDIESAGGYFYYDSTYGNISVAGTASSYGYDNGVWTKAETRSDRMVGMPQHLKSSTVDIYNGHDKTSVFFQGTPLSPPTLEEIKEASLQTMKVKIVNHMEVLCLVGCLILSMLLAPVLVRYLRRFLPF